MKHLGIAGVAAVAALGASLACNSGDDDDGGGSDQTPYYSGGQGNNPYAQNPQQPAPTGGLSGVSANNSYGFGGAAQSQQQPMGSGGTISGSGGRSSVDVASSGGGTTGTSSGTNPYDGSSAVDTCGNTFKGLDADCGSHEVTAHSVPVNLLLVMDKSGSMDETPAGYPDTKWQTLDLALRESLGDVRHLMSMGLKLFPAYGVEKECVDDNSCCDVAIDIDVPIDRGTRSVANIYNRMQTAEPGGGTPTSLALQTVVDYFASGGGAGADSYVLLATDGGPNCGGISGCPVAACTLHVDETADCARDEVNESFNCCNLNPDGCLDDDATLQRIQQLADLGVKTFVVGIPGSERYADNLKAFARAGGMPTKDAEGNDTYYAVSAQGGASELTETIKDITIKLVQSCEVRLDQDPPSVTEVNVAVDCEIVPNVSDPNESGWVLDELTQPMSIVLTGDYCDRITTEGVDRVDVILGCPTIF